MVRANMEDLKEQIMTIIRAAKACGQMLFQILFLIFRTSSLYYEDSFKLSKTRNLTTCVGFIQ
jgi:hypothetical protein